MASAKWEKLMKMLVAGRHTAVCSSSSTKQTNVAGKMNVKFGRQTIASRKSPKDRIGKSLILMGPALQGNID